MYIRPGGERTMQMNATNQAFWASDKPRDAAAVGHHISIFVRCLIEHKDTQWQGFSLEYGLAVQGISKHDVKRRLEGAILSYVYDALVGEDREHADQLLTRRAVPAVYLRYYLYKLGSLFSFGNKNASEHKVYREPLALEPRMCSP
jgi:hypothetical protein